MPFASSIAEALPSRRWLRYLGGSALCALVNNVVLIGLDAVGAPLLSGVLLSWFVGGVTGYVWHSRLTYREALSWAAFARFMSGAFMGIPLAWATIWLFTVVLGWPMWIAAPAMTVVMFCYHYLNAFIAIRWTKAVATIRRRSA